MSGNSRKHVVCQGCGEKLNRMAYGSSMCEECWDRDDL